MLTIWVEMLTFSMSFGAAGSRSLGSGSCSPSFVGVSPGRLFFFSLDVGGCRRDCDCPGCTYKPRISRHERTTPKSGYARLNLIVFNSRGARKAPNGLMRALEPTFTALIGFPQRRKDAKAN